MSLHSKVNQENVSGVHMEQVIQVEDVCTKLPLKASEVDELDVEQVTLTSASSIEELPASVAIVSEIAKDTETNKRKTSSLCVECATQTETLSSVECKDNSDNDTVLLRVNKIPVLDMKDGKEANTEKVKCMLHDVNNTTNLFYEMLVNEYNNYKRHNFLARQVTKTNKVLFRSTYRLSISTRLLCFGIVMLYAGLGIVLYFISQCGISIFS